MRNPRWIVLALLAVVVWGCHGSENVTGVESGVHLTIHLSTTSSHTIQRAKLTLDGRDVVTAEPPGGAEEVTLDTTVNGVERGSHTLKVVIVRQASSPNSYFAAGAVATQDRILDLAPVQGVLATGESLEIKVNF